MRGAGGAPKIFPKINRKDNGNNNQLSPPPKKFFWQKASGIPIQNCWWRHDFPEKLPSIFPRGSKTRERGERKMRLCFQLLKTELHVCFPLFSLQEPLTQHNLDANFLGRLWPHKRFWITWIVFWLCPFQKIVTFHLLFPCSVYTNSIPRKLWKGMQSRFQVFGTRFKPRGFKVRSSRLGRWQALCLLSSRLLKNNRVIFRMSFSLFSDLIIVDFDLCLLAGDKFFWSNDTGTVNWILGLDRIFIFHSVCPLFSAFLAVRTKEFCCLSGQKGNSCIYPKTIRECRWWDAKPSALAIELNSSKAIAGKELSLSSWCIASLYIYNFSTVVDLSSERHSKWLYWTQELLAPVEKFTVRMSMMGLELATPRL